jgi:hypothetical protein
MLGGQGRFVEQLRPLGVPCVQEGCYRQRHSMCKGPGVGKHRTWTGNVSSVKRGDSAREGRA